MTIFISVSGESENLINGMIFANQKSIKTASLTGSSSMNTLKNKSRYSLWVDSKAYNIVESIQIWITLIIDLLVGVQNIVLKVKHKFLNIFNTT